MTNPTNKDPLIHFPFYINQYQGILSRYSLEEKGAFISLLCVFLAEDSQLPDNQDQLFRMCLAFTEGERKAVLSVKDKVVETGLEILKYQKEKREKCRESARIGGLARVAKAQAIAQETLKRPSSNKETEKETETDINKDKEEEEEEKKKSKGFIRPTLQEIQNYCQERKNSINPEKWLNFYQSNGWKVGKNSMKDWKAAIRTWETNSFTSPTKPQSKHNNFEQQDYYANTEGFEVC